MYHHLKTENNFVFHYHINEYRYSPSCIVFVSYAILLNTMHYDHKKKFSWLLHLLLPQVCAYYERCVEVQYDASGYFVALEFSRSHEFLQ